MEVSVYKALMALLIAILSAAGCEVTADDLESIEGWPTPPSTTVVPTTSHGPTTTAPPTLPPTTTAPTTTVPASTTTAPGSTTTSTTTTAAPTTTTTSTTTAPPTTTTTPGGVVHFETLPLGAELPSGAECAALVRPAAEVRPGNTVFNNTTGSGPHPDFPRVDGNFTGTTDEILQWVACKWGIDEDIVRAQVVKESWWDQTAGGDLTWNPDHCHPSVRAQSPCPESLGLLQVRYHYHGAAIDDSIASSAYNVDYTYAVMRSCFEGNEGWLNTVDRGAEYGAGDLWGCLGVWFSGRWYTEPANGYIADVQRILNERTWEQPYFPE